MLQLGWSCRARSGEQLWVRHFARMGEARDKAKGVGCGGGNTMQGAVGGSAVEGIGVLR